MPTRSRWAAAALALAAVLALGACASNSSSKAGQEASHGASAASSALANPTISSDLNAEETLLLNNLKNNFNAAHPLDSVRTAVKLTFPKGNVPKIENYAVKTFTVSVMSTSGPGSARDKWLMGVVAFAQSSQGAGPSSPATPAPATTAAGQASIPGASA